MNDVDAASSVRVKIERESDAFMGQHEGSHDKNSKSAHQNTNKVWAQRKRQFPSIQDKFINIIKICKEWNKYAQEHCAQHGHYAGPDQTGFPSRRNFVAGFRKKVFRQFAQERHGCRIQPADGKQNFSITPACRDSDGCPYEEYDHSRYGTCGRSLSYLYRQIC